MSAAADERARVPAQALGILTARTLANSHSTLLELLEAGMSVLDVGCGPGTLTAEIARRVHPGRVVGLDLNSEMIRLAEASSPLDAPNLAFCAADIRQSIWNSEFDLVNATRVLQWIPDPAKALAAMARAVVPGGLVVVRDFDHTRARWSSPRKEWTRFYDAFLRWRQAGGLDNSVARHLPPLFGAAGIVDITYRDQSGTVRADDADFFRVAGLWRMVIDSRGRQMVAAGYLTEAERRSAQDAFTEWMTAPDASQTLSEGCAVGRRPRRPAVRARRRGPARPSRRAE